jgi:hypothetical protein
VCIYLWKYPSSLFAFAALGVFANISLFFSVFVDETGIPQTIRPSYERLRDIGAYLLEDGSSMFLWIGKNCNPLWLYNVLGASNFQTIDPQMVLGFVNGVDRSPSHYRSLLTAGPYPLHRTDCLQLAKSSRRVSAALLTCSFSIVTKK